MKPTLEEIAEKCGVSRGTVDRVVHGRPHVRPEIRDLVLAALEESGYVRKKELKKRKNSPNFVKIAFLVPKWSDPYFSAQTYSGIHQAEHALNDPEFHVHIYELLTRTEEETVSVLERMPAEQVNGVIVNAQQSISIQVAIDKLVAQGISVVTYDSDVPQSKRTCFIGQDLYRSGAIAAGLMARFLRPQDKILIVTGNMDFEFSHGRVNGFVRQLQSQGFDSDCYAIEECYEQYDLTRNAVYRALHRMPYLRAIYMVNESITGCIEGVRKAEKLQQVKIICNDLTPSAKKYLQNGQVDFIIGQTFTAKAYKSITTLHRLLRRGIQPERERLYTDSFILTRELL